MIILKSRRIIANVITIQLMATFILLHPMELLAQPVSPIPTPSDCHLSYTNPIAMNTVISSSPSGGGEGGNGPREVAKTIHVEKETFVCPQALFDQDIYVKKIEDLSDGIPIPLKGNTTYEVVTCAKDSHTGDVMGCEDKIPNNSSAPISGSCQQGPWGKVQLTDPLQMNTIVAPYAYGNIIKTVEAQKEVFGCPTVVSPRIIKDVTIYTEIFENFGSHAVETTKTYDTVICTKVVANLNVTGCQDSPRLPIPITNKP